MDQQPPPFDGDEIRFEIAQIDLGGAAGQPRPMEDPSAPGASAPMRLPRTVLILTLACAVLALGIPQVRGSVLIHLRRGAGAPATGAMLVLHPPAAPRMLPPPLVLLPTPPLAAAPNDCSPAPPLSMVEMPVFGLGVGRAPVYVAGLQGHPLKLRLGGPDGKAYTQYGWLAQIEWALDPGYAQRVTVSVGYPHAGSVGLLTVSQWRAPAPSAVLDPVAADDVPMRPHWNEWMGTVFLPVAGCYLLQASWSGGAWAIPFAAGR